MQKDYLMEDFQVQDHLIIQLDILSKIREYCLCNAPYESGGLILKDKKVIFCDSFYNDKYNFYPDNNFYLHLTKPENIAYSFHSHPDWP